MIWENFRNCGEVSLQDYSYNKGGNVAHLVRCPVCGAINRLSDEGLSTSLRPVCGKCKAPLFHASEPVRISDANFAQIAGGSPLPVLLDMWAAWCGPCIMLGPVIDELAVELAGRVTVGKLNVDENPVIAGRFNVRSIPTMLILKDGKEVGRIVGAVPKSEILRRLNAVVG